MAGPEGNYRAAIFDLSGKKHIEAQFSLASERDGAQIDVAETPPGIYLLKITNTKGRNAFIKFSKTN